MMKILVATLLVYALGLLFTAVGSRLAGRCTTWCCALLGLPMWVVGGTVAPFCLALPQLMLAFLAAGMSVTALAVGTALAGAVTNLGLALSVCLLRKRHCAVADRDEFCRKCLLLLSACGRRAATSNRRNTKNPLAQRLGFFVWSPTALGLLGASSP